MLINNFKIIIRQIASKKLFSIITLTSLAIGIVSFILLLQYVRYEFQFDNFHKNKKGIFRVQADAYEAGILAHSFAQTPPMLGELLLKQIPEVDKIVRVRRPQKITIEYADKKINSTRIITEFTFFEIFSFDLIRGTKDHILSGTNNIVISESIAKKLFNSIDPLGKTIKISDNKKSFVVTGVFQDVPMNSHLRFDVILPFDVNDRSWYSFNYYTYLKLRKENNLNDVQPKLIKVIKDHAPPDLARDFKFILQPLGKIHLYSDLLYDTENGNIRTVKFLILISLIVISISWINYVNITMIRSMERAKEVGIRKVLGSYKLLLIKQFMLESSVLNLLPIIIALMVIPFVFPLFKTLVSLDLDKSFILNRQLIYILIFLFAGGTFVTGLYPAFIQSSFKPVTMLNKVKLSNSSMGKIVRVGLLSIQLFASIFLITFSIVIYKQVHFMINMNREVDVHNVMSIEMPNSSTNDSLLVNKVKSIKNELIKSSFVANISISSAIPGNDPGYRASAWLQGNTPNSPQQHDIVNVDYDYFAVYNIKLLKGRFFSREYKTDNEGVIINQAALNFLGFQSTEEAIDKVILIFGKKHKYKIIGVVKNFNHVSMKRSIEPLIFLFSDREKFVSIKLKEYNRSNVINHIKSIWNKFIPNESFNYYFVEDNYNNMYKDEVRLNEIIFIFSILSLLMTGMGVLGISLYNITLKNKELAIRKVIGAGDFHIFYFLIKKYFILLICIGLLAWPLTSIYISSWLNHFVYRTNISFWVHILPIVIVSGILLISVSYHILLAVRTNPINALKQE